MNTQTPYMAAALEIKDLLHASCSPEFIAKIIEDHTGKIHAPDPEALGVELAEYLRERYESLPEEARCMIDGTSSSANDVNVPHVVFLLEWERDFWREKALGTL